MGDDGVVFCYNEHPNIGISWNWKGDYQKGSTIIDNNNVILNNRYHTYVDNWLFCEFTLMKETRITIPTQGRTSIIIPSDPHLLVIASRRETPHKSVGLGSMIHELSLDRVEPSSRSEGKASLPEGSLPSERGRPFQKGL